MGSAQPATGSLLTALFDFAALGAGPLSHSYFRMVPLILEVVPFGSPEMSP
jgi:hypothetical protein